MKFEFPTPVPEIPVRDVATAAAYYRNNFGFRVDSGGQEISAPESKPWGLHEFMAADLDGNLFRVFHDFATHIRTRALAFTSEDREGIRRGEICCGVRIWIRPHVKVGGRCPVDDGHIVVDSIEETSLDNITEDLARESGCRSAANLLRAAKHSGEEHIYLIRFHYSPPPSSS